MTETRSPGRSQRKAETETETKLKIETTVGNESKATVSAQAMQGLGREISQMVHGAMAQALRDAAAVDVSVPHLRVARALAGPAAGSGVRALAALHPGGATAKREATALYTRCLKHYRQQVQPKLDTRHTSLDQPDNTDDLGIAAAYFVLANLAACHDAEPDPAALPAVERQLRRLLTQTAAWGRMAVAEQQSLFEQLALLGVLVNESRLAARQQGAAATANVQTAARGYLQQLLGLSPDRLSASVQGLAVAEQMH